MEFAPLRLFLIAAGACVLVTSVCAQTTSASVPVATTSSTPTNGFVRVAPPRITEEVHLRPSQKKNAKQKDAWVKDMQPEMQVLLRSQSAYRKQQTTKEVKPSTSKPVAVSTKGPTTKVGGANAKPRTRR